MRTMRIIVVAAIFLVAIFSNYLAGALLPDNPFQVTAVTAAFTVLAATALAYVHDTLKEVFHGLARMEEN